MLGMGLITIILEFKVSGKAYFVAKKILALEYLGKAGEFEIREQRVDLSPRKSSLNHGAIVRSPPSISPGSGSLKRNLY